MSSVLRMTLRRDVAELGRLRKVAAPFLEGCGASARTTYRASLALEEAVSNVVRHAEGARDIAVEIAIAGDAVDLLVEDDGPPFDPLLVPAPDISGPLEHRPTSGLGIHLLRRMTDEIRYERVDSRNRVSMRILSAPR